MIHNEGLKYITHKAELGLACLDSPSCPKTLYSITYNLWRRPEGLFLSRMPQGRATTGSATRFRPVIQLPSNSIERG